MNNLEGKVAIVTGAGSGIGKAVAMLYASEGAKVVVSDIDTASGQETMREIQSLRGEAIFVKADTSKPKDHKALVDKTVKVYGRLDISFNNAGILGQMLPAGEYTIDGWDKIISINLSGVFYGMHYQIPAMLANGGGCIVNTASILGSVGTKNLAGYVAAKHGVVGLTRTAALDYATKKIRINCVGPGYIKTPLLTKVLDKAAMKALEKLHPIDRLGTSEEVAELVLWLSSSKASFVTGSYYTVDGGYTAQ